MRISLLDLSIQFSLLVFALELLPSVPFTLRSENLTFTLKPKSPIGDYFLELNTARLKFGSVEMKIASPVVVKPNSFNSLLEPFRSG